MNVITISREFGSGGREVGKRLADALGYAYYDREILTALAESTEMEETYLEHILERGAAAPPYPLAFGRTFFPAALLLPSFRLFDGKTDGPDQETR